MQYGWIVFKFLLKLDQQLTALAVIGYLNSQTCYDHDYFVIIYRKQNMKKKLVIGLQEIQTKNSLLLMNGQLPDMNLTP